MHNFSAARWGSGANSKHAGSCLMHLLQIPRLSQSDLLVYHNMLLVQQQQIANHCMICKRCLPVVGNGQVLQLLACLGHLCSEMSAQLGTPVAAYAAVNVQFWREAGTVPCACLLGLS